MLVSLHYLIKNITYAAQEELHKNAVLYYHICRYHHSLHITGIQHSHNTLDSNSRQMYRKYANRNSKSNEPIRCLTVLS